MQRIEELYRAIHSIKGNASLLDLQLLVNASHDFEDKVEKIRERNAATWDDFIPLALDVAKLQDTISGLKDLLRRLQTFRHEGGQVHESAIATIPENIRTMVERIAAEHGKEIDVSFTEFSADRVPARFAYILRDIGVQLARNAVVHGFETPENRRKAGKHDRGSLTLSLSQVSDDVIFTVRDDGRSFDLDAIRRKTAARQGLSQRRS
jgi:chemotaxis protein histidine kinase CheA